MRNVRGGQWSCSGKQNKNKISECVQYEAISDIKKRMNEKYGYNKEANK